MAATVPVFSSLRLPHRQNRTTATQPHPQMAAFRRLEGGPLPFEPPLQFRARHPANKLYSLGKPRSRWSEA